MKLRRPGSVELGDREAAGPGRQLGGKMPAAKKIQNIRNRSYGGPANETAPRPSESPERRASVRWGGSDHLSTAILQQS
jgi:hypothetical protein